MIARQPDCRQAAEAQLVQDGVSAVRKAVAKVYGMEPAWAISFQRLDTVQK